MKNKQTENNKSWQGCTETGTLSDIASGNENGTDDIEHSLAVPQKVKQNYYMTQKFYSYIYTHKKWKKVFKQTLVNKCSEQCFSQWSKGRNNPNVYQLINEEQNEVIL